MKKALLALAAVLALVLTASALGDDFSQGKGAKAAPNWKVLSLGSSGQTFRSTPPYFLALNVIREVVLRSLVVKSAEIHPAASA